MSNNNVQNVSVGKPKKGGAMFVAPVGTALPTNATTALNVAFENVGYISEDGLTNSNSPESSEIKAWGGDTVLSMQTAKKDTFKFTLIESLNTHALKLVYGSSNVTGDISTGIAITANSDDTEEHAIVVEMVMRGGVLKRIVIPRAKVTNVEDIVYKDGGAVGYGTTVTATPDASGNTHYEYIISSAE